MLQFIFCLLHYMVSNVSIAFSVYFSSFLVVARGQTMVVSWWLVRGAGLVRLWADRSVHVGVVFFSLCGRGAGVVFNGDELVTSGYARVRRGEGQGGSRARGGGGWAPLCGERTKGGPLHGVSWLRADGFFLRVVRIGSSASGRAAGAGCPDTSSTVNLTMFA